MYRGFREKHMRGYHTAYNGDRGRKQTYGASWTNERRDRGQEAEKDRRRGRHARGREQNALLRLLPVLERLERGARAHHQRVLHAVLALLFVRARQPGAGATTTRGQDSAPCGPRRAPRAAGRTTPSRTARARRPRRRGLRAAGRARSLRRGVSVSERVR
jgi:hypothetical protein